MLTHIRPGLYIHGLRQACVEMSLMPGEVAPRAAGIVGSWTFEHNYLSANVLTFKKGPGTNRVTILPYLKEGTSFTTSNGGPVISGPFSGCIMRGFKKDGVYQVAHVNRTYGPDNNALDTQWAQFGASEVVDHPTGTHLSDWLVPKIVDDKKYKESEKYNFAIWVIAMPHASSWRFCEFLVHNKADGKMKVMKVF